MKIDVSDLFDDLYDVAALARAKFELSQTIEPDRYCSEWQRFCDILSDTLFLPACASRVFGLTHNKISNEQVKSRIITEKLSTNGKCKFYSRYIGPDFVSEACFFATPWVENDYGSSHRRQNFNLVLWLGELPPSEVELIPPSYPAHLDAQLQYFARVWYTFHTTRPQINYYEFHGDWCLREVKQSDASFVRETLGGQWRRFDDLSTIQKETFETLWNSATEAL